MNTFLMISGIVFWIGVIVSILVLSACIDDAGSNDQLNNDPDL